MILIKCFYHHVILVVLIKQHKTIIILFIIHHVIVHKIQLLVKQHVNFDEYLVRNFLI